MSEPETEPEPEPQPEPAPGGASDLERDDVTGSSRRWRAGCLGGCAGLLALAVVLFFAIGLYFDEGDSASRPGGGFDAGPASAYEPGTVNQLPEQHAWVVRLPDGTLYVFYDKSSKQQELGGECRVLYDETAGLGTVNQIEGMVGAFVEDCEGARTVWRVDGQLAFGAGYGNLDRFDTQEDPDGQLIIDTGSRSCTRSRGAPGIPPFDEERCGSGD